MTSPVLLGYSTFLTMRSRARLGSRWVALGDSITQGVNNARWTDTAQFASIGRLQLVKNAGIGGDTAAQMLARFDTDVTPYAPNVVTLLAGTNDTGVTSLASFQTSIKAIVAKCGAIGAVPVLLTLPPNSTGAPANRKQQIIAFNAWLRAYARDTGLPLVDAYNLFVDPANGNFLAAYNGDGTHPNPAGMAALGSLVNSALASNLPPSGTLLPNDQSDTNNLLQNPLFLGDSGNPGVKADQWSTYGTGATYSLNKTDTAIKGNWQNWTLPSGGPTGITNGLGGTVPVAGHTLAVCGLFRVASGALTIWLTVDGANAVSPVSSYSQPLAKGAFYTEYVVPAGAHTSAGFTATAAGASDVGLAQVGIYDLTAMGLA